MQRTRLIMNLYFSGDAEIARLEFAPQKYTEMQRWIMKDWKMRENEALESDGFAG